jgi:hypothetical protein
MFVQPNRVPYELQDVAREARRQWEIPIVRISAEVSEIVRRMYWPLADPNE